MFDLTESVEINGFALNTTEIVEGKITGCALDVFSPDDLDVVQFREKRSQSDGLDAGPPFLGGRRIVMAGTLYGSSRADLWDRTQDLRRALSATLSYRTDLDSKGFIPLYGQRPTARIDDYADGVILLRALCLPTGLHADIQRDNTGGADTDPLALPWQTQLVMRDPAFQGREPQLYQTEGGELLTLVNRGDYHTPLDWFATVTDAGGTITVEAGGSVGVFTIPSSSVNRFLRYDGRNKVFYATEEGDDASLRMGWMDFTNDTTHPLIPAGESPATVTLSDGLTLVTDTTVLLSFFEAWA